MKIPTNGSSYLSFEGIPYANPPMRFSKPVLSVSNPGPSPYQAIMKKPQCVAPDVKLPLLPSEDCLYLDIYVPRRLAQINPQLPVMVWFHGGGFLYAGPHINPENLVSSGVIVVKVNYRLGALGFLSTGDDVAKGNWGLWDQRAALVWLRNNIQSFGGNKDNITVFGNSAGSASVAFQLLSPHSKGLFSRAVLLSGSATSTWGLQRHPMALAHRLGRALGCDRVNNDLITCLRSKSAEDIQKKTIEIRNAMPVYPQLTDYLFVPVVDGDFILDEPRRMLKNSSHLQRQLGTGCDVLLGITNNEAAHVSLRTELPKQPKFGEFFQREMLAGELTQRYGKTNATAERVLDDFYRHDADLLSLNVAHVADAHGDPAFFIPVMETAIAFSAAQQTVVGQIQCIISLPSYITECMLVCMFSCLYV